MFSGEFACFQNDPLAGKRKVTAAVLCAVILLALIPRIAGVILYPGTLYHNDGKEYRDIAEQISMGNGFSVSGYRWYEAVPDVKETVRTDFSRPPVLPLLGAGLFLLPFDWEASARVTVLIMSVISTLMVFLLGREVFRNDTVGVLAAVIYAFYPYAIYYSLCWCSENLFLIFVCAAWLFLVRALRMEYNWKQCMFCGFFLALATMTRPQGAILFVLTGLCALCMFLAQLRKDKVPAMKLFRGAIVFGITSLLVFAPWMIRNWYHCGIPSPFSFYGAYSFAQASSDVSYVTYRCIDTPQYKEKTDAAWNQFHTEKTALLKQKNAFTLIDADPYWRQWAWEYIRENPEKMAFIVKSRLLHCFRAAPNAAAVPPVVVILLRIFFLILLALILCGIWFSRRDIAARSLLLPPLGVVIMAVPFLMILRYRYPFFAPFASVLAAYGFYALCCLYAVRRRRIT